MFKGHSPSGQGGPPLTSPLRSDGSQDDQVGEAAQQRQRVSKLGLKGPSDYHSNETAVKAAGRAASGPS